MQVDVQLFEGVVGNAQAARAGAHDGAGGFDGLFHHIAQHAGAQDVAFAGHGGGFNGEQVAAHFRPGQAHDLADLVVLFGAAIGELAHAQKVAQVFGGDFHFRLQLHQLQALDDFAADARDFALQRAHARFARVVAHDVAHGVFGNAQLRLFDAVGLHLLGQQVAHGDAGFFVFGVARQANDFHAVQQRGRNVHGVAGGHEHHV